jgi:hypothetical protein
VSQQIPAIPQSIAGADLVATLNDRLRRINVAMADIAATPAAAAAPAPAAASGIIGTLALTGLNAPISPTNLLIAGAMIPAGTYRIWLYAVMTVAGTAGAFSPYISANDGATRTQYYPGNMPATSVGVLSGVLVVKTAGSAQVQYGVTALGVTGAPQYSLTLMIEKMA